jgi:4-hydroxy-tetrahydrodipicolinate synthase
MLGTVGENCSVEFHEKIELLKAVVSHVNKRVPVLTGVAEYTTALACRFAEAAQGAGVDGLMVMPAMVYKSDKRETISALSDCSESDRFAHHDLQQPSSLRG